METLVNKQAPDFKLEDQDGKTHSLADYRGQYVLLYFYPKDMTPGCTIEAQQCRNKKADFDAMGVQVLGVSADDVESHKKFAQKESLNFPLLADVDREVIEAYGVWGEKMMFGKTSMGILRDSFLIDPEGKVVKHYEKVDPNTHADEVIADVQARL